MQLDFFSEPKPAAPAIELLEHAVANYAPRTGENARGADVTVAFAVDYSTAGEKLTHRVAGQRYVAVPYGSDPVEAARQLTRFLRSKGGTSLNVAGNGIYTLTKVGVTQAAANQWVFEVLRQVHADVGLTHVRSGGQTGIDTAGLVAGIALKVPVTGLYPKGFRQRRADQVDVERSVEDLLRELNAAVTRLHSVARGPSPASR